MEGVNEYIIPILDFNYIGDNENLNDMWTDSEFHNKIGEYVFCKQDEIKILKFDFYNHFQSDSFEIFSKNDVYDIALNHWAFQFKSTQKQLYKIVKKLNLFLLICRIDSNSSIGIKYVICRNAPHLSDRFSEFWKPALIGSKSGVEHFNTTLLKKLLIRYNRLLDFNSLSTRTAHALNFLLLAYTSYYWMESFILFITSLETLVSPSSENQITSKILKRTVKLINNVEICSKTKLEKLYELRSNIIHGRILVDLNFKEYLDNIQKLQIIVLTAFKTILNKNFKTIYLDEESKENFYTNLENDN